MTPSQEIAVRERKAVFAALADAGFEVKHHSERGSVYFINNYVLLHDGPMLLRISDHEPTPRPGEVMWNLLWTSPRFFSQLRQLLDTVEAARAESAPEPTPKEQN